MATRGQGESQPTINWSIDDPPSLESFTETSATSHIQTLQAHRFGATQSEQELLALEEVKDKVKLLDHQLSAAHRAITNMGRGLLFADEVGLGKTIEIGMVLKELDLRDTRDSFLVLTPAQLAPQWQQELDDKFGLDFVCNYDDEFQGFDAHDRIVASVDTAKSSRYKEEVLSRRWDALVLDEAHYVRNEDTKRYSLIEQIEYEEAFFATATPIQNDITDLYNITNLIRPGLLGTSTEFEDRYVADGDDTQIKNADALQRKLDRVMIRNRREETDIDFTNRDVRTNTFEPTTAEEELYDTVTNYVRSNYSSEDAKHLVLLLLQKEVVSSPSAVLGTVNKWLDGEGSTTVSNRERDHLHEIKEAASEISDTTKQQRLREIVTTIHDQLDTTRVVVFTQFRETQKEVAESVRKLDQPVHVVNGDCSSTEKEAIVADFEAEGGVLVATDSISEGRNMQFCNVMVNYDLPWNPMKVEQRIGRIDRIGQERDVHVFNLALADTVEEHVLEKLYGKINLFTQSIGGLREILSRMEKSGADFEREVFERVRTADSRVELENNFEEMAVDLEENKEAAEKMSEFNKGVFDSFEFGDDS
ncbi:ATP-dependent RNA helicase protein [Halorhabdus tiamatea SARL4B]|uniref:ATP-dependent RNA helicase protein n=2 Tax=Halorhabdus tiamatea SARL4B TaxID=1033806 RepID=U2DIB2_9EURY|nr:SNF2-related protein [Halorhabdus tiamatea]ERJ05687.1 ATP-dependent RNA helicase protein [Halorhabdus tiamatea SARL4B]